MSKCDDESCNICHDCDCDRVDAIDTFAQELQASPKTRKNLDLLGKLVAQIRDIVISDTNIAESMFNEQSIAIVASCPNSTELVLVDIRMISQLPEHELEMMRDF